MNTGRAASVHEALDPQNDWHRFTSGGVLVKNCRPTHATLPSAMAIQTPPASSTSSRAKTTRPAASGVIVPPSCLPEASYRFREVARSAPLFLGDLVGGLLLLDHQNQLVQHGDEEDRHADEKGHLRDPDRHLDQALRDLLEL